MRIGFVGAGAVANALAVALDRVGEPVVAVASRDYSDAERLASRLASCTPVQSAHDVSAHVEMVFLTVPDRLIEDVCDSVQWRSGQIVLHCSGALSLDLLESARRAGADTGSFHPLQSFSGGENDAALLSGAAIGIEAAGRLSQVLQRLAKAIGGRPIMLRSGQKPLYHAAAVMISNYTVTLAALSANLCTTLGLERDEAMNMLTPLLQGTVANLAKRGIPRSLTGPIARGDLETVERHLVILSQQAPDTVPLYKLLGLNTVPLARELGGVDEYTAQRVVDVLQRDHESA